MNTKNIKVVWADDLKINEIYKVDKETFICILLDRKNIQFLRATTKVVYEIPRESFDLYQKFGFLDPTISRPFIHYQDTNAQEFIATRWKAYEEFQIAAYKEQAENIIGYKMLNKLKGKDYTPSLLVYQKIVPSTNMPSQQIIQKATLIEQPNNLKSDVYEGRRQPQDKTF